MVAFVLALGTLVLGGEAPRIDLADWPVRIGGEAQLFADDFLVARGERIEYALHRPEKHPANPLVTPAPSVERLVLAYGSVIREKEGGPFRLWYTNDTGIAYAESADGVRWEKPAVGIARDGRPTNILTRGHRGRSDTLTVFLNPDASDIERKYLAYVFEYRFPDRDGVREERREGLYLRASPDGIAWRERPEPVMYSMWRNPADRPAGTEGDLGDVHHVSWDPKLGKFMGHVKLSLGGVRKRGLTESDDGIHWSHPRLILEADERDRPGDQTYSMIAFPYESVWLAYVGLYHKGTDDRMDIQLAVSRDGRNWSRPLRGAFLANGPAGAFDWGVLHMAANPPIRVGDALWIYYGGYDTVHGTKLPDVRQFGIGLSMLRPDGFVSVDARGTPGSLVTRPLCFEGGKLAVNASIGAGGSLAVAVLDRSYRPLEGYRREDCAPLSGDGLGLPVRWKTTNTLPPAGEERHVRLQFFLADASLYSFRIE